MVRPAGGGTAPFVCPQGKLRASIAPTVEGMPLAPLDSCLRGNDERWGVGMTRELGDVRLVREGRTQDRRARCCEESG